MDSVAARAARYCGHTTPTSQSADAKIPWKRAPRTHAAAAARTRAIDAAKSMLEKAAVEFTESLPGKLVVHPPPGRVAGQVVTFWPARARLRLGNRPTKRGQGIREFEEVLANQGHPIAGYPNPVSKSDAFLQFRRALAERVDQWLERQAHLEDAKSALDECLAIQFQWLRDLADGQQVKGRNQQLREAKRRFRSARRRAMGRGGLY